jgi:transposase
MKITTQTIVDFYTLHKSGVTIKECAEKLGFSKVTLYKIQKQMIELGLDPRPDNSLEKLIKEAKKKIK